MSARRALLLLIGPVLPTKMCWPRPLLKSPLSSNSVVSKLGFKVVLAKMVVGSAATGRMAVATKPNNKPAIRNGKRIFFM